MRKGYDVLDVGGQDTTSGSVQILRRRRKGEVRKQHIQLVCKRCSGEESQCIPIGKRCRNTVEWRMC